MQMRSVKANQFPVLDVVYILGTGRCGTTLLDVMLGQQGNLWTTGEIQHLQRWISKNEPCGCGNAISKCDFWAQVLDEVSNEVIDEVGLLRRPPYESGKALRWNYIWRFLLNFEQPQTAEYTAANTRLFRSVACHANKLRGENVHLIDASKDVYRLQMLTCEKDISLRVIYIWRNPSGFVSSMMYDAKRQSTAALVRYAIRWNVQNVLFLLAIYRLEKSRYLIINFDNFVSRFEIDFQKIVQFCGGSFDKEKTTSTRESPNHGIAGDGIAGNSPRYLKLKVRPLKPKLSLSLLEVSMINIITWPLQWYLRSLTVKTEVRVSQRKI